MNPIKTRSHFLLSGIILSLFLSCAERSQPAINKTIERFTLVSRNNVYITSIDILEALSVPEYENLYLPGDRALEAFSNDENRRDQPMVLGAFVMSLIGKLIETAVMSKTSYEILRKSNWQTTWRWDYPMIASNDRSLEWIHPGFSSDVRWNIKWENLKKMPYLGFRIF